MGFQPSLFHAERTRRRRSLPLNAQAQRDGFVRSRRSAARQSASVLEHLRLFGPSTDHQLSAALGFTLGSASRARNTLMRQGRVMAVDLVRGEFGALRTRWAAVDERGE